MTICFSFFLFLGNLGFQELLLLLGTIIPVWLLIKLLKNVSWIEARLGKWFEARLLTRLPAAAPGWVQLRLRLLPLPFSLVAVFGMLVISIVLSVITTVINQGIQPSWVTPCIDFLGLVFVIGCIMTALLIHFYPSGDRKLKYELLVSGVSMSSIGVFVPAAAIIGDTVGSQQSRFSDTHLAPEAAAGAALVYGLFIVLAQVFCSVVVELQHGKTHVNAPSCTLRRYYRLVRRLGYPFAVLSFSGLLQPLLLVYLNFRYALGESMSRAPILYLRSFRYANGPTAFGRIIARVASRYGPIVALAHESQRPLAVHAHTRLTERAILQQVSDEKWRDWIEGQMIRASVILLDYSLDTEGLTWELDRAVTLVEPSRIFVLYQRGIVINPPANIWKLEYEMGRKAEKKARQKLNQQLETMLLTT